MTHTRDTHETSHTANGYTHKRAMRIHNAYTRNEMRYNAADLQMLNYKPQLSQYIYN